MRELAAALPRALAAFPARIASRPPRLSLDPRTRRRLALAALAALAVGCLYWLWLRDSPLVAVERVEVSGLTSGDARTIRAALVSAAEEMTTLHVRVDELEEVAAHFPVIKAIEVERDLPNALRIRVTEHRPAALVLVGDVAVPAAADGTVLEGLQPPDGLPVLPNRKPAADGRVTDARTLRALAVIGAAPGALPQRVERVVEGGEHGLVVELEDGPDVLFGDARRVQAKWVAATRVLADPDAQGAAYVDVRLPERPVAGGLPVETVEPVVPAGEPVAVPPADAAALAEGEAAPAPAVTDPAAAAPVAPPAAGEPVPPNGAAPAPSADPTIP